MGLHFENCLTGLHLRLFGRIVQSFARHEAMMEEVMAKVSGADPTSVKLMTSHLPFGWKRATMLNLLRHRGLPIDRVDEVQWLFEPAHTNLALRDDIAHSTWVPCEPEGLVRPTWLSSEPKVAAKPQHDIDGGGKSYIEDYDERFAYTLESLTEIADQMEESETKLHDYLASADLSAS